MRTVPENLKTIISAAVTGLGYELLGIEMFSKGHSGTVLRVYIDHMDGISLDDCSLVSQQLSGVLDVADPIAGQYDLEVSSPGANRPLFELAHFERFKGNKVRVALLGAMEGRKRFNGTLVGTSKQEVLIAEGEVLYHIPLDKIDTARIVPDF
ncbi:hypothetical protein TI04_00810 [Achromatium sp. WMS2]|nr:hypothetical protein TI04_00810 [Achromatium sp. WMS2]